MAEWEVYALNQNTTTLDRTHFKAFQQALVQDAEQQRHEGARAQGREGEEVVELSSLRVVPRTRKQIQEGRR